MAHLAANLDELDPDGDGDVAPARAAAVAPPQVFVRTFVTPAGLPWDQAQAAQLEARHGAPLPIADLVHRVRRLEGWRPGRPARFAVFYVRRRDYTAPFETTLDVDGEPVRVAFGTGAAQLKQARRVGLLALALAGSAVLAVAAGTVVISARGEAAEELDTLERLTAAKLRLARRHEAARLQSRDLAALQRDAGLPGDVLADLAWVARARTADARIVAVHWDRGLLAIEARGDAPPLAAADREVVRAPQAVRPGVMLWGVSRAPAEPGRGR